MKKPLTGGRFERDKKSKKLTRVQDPTKPADIETVAAVGMADDTNPSDLAASQNPEGA